MRTASRATENRKVTGSTPVGATPEAPATARGFFAPGPARRYARSVPADRLSEAFATRANALGTVRLLLAAAVVLSHAYLLLGRDTALTQLLGAWAVNGFFALSGYLIAESRLRLPLGRFLWHRALRILPAFWTVLIAAALVAAPLATLLNGADWPIGGALDYILRNAGLVIVQAGIGSTLAGSPYGEWNAPLWTLAHEATAYLVAGLALSIAAVRRRPLLWTAAAMAAFMLAALIAFGPFGIPDPTRVVGHGIRLGAFFVAGMLLHALRDRLPLRWWLAAASAAGLLALQSVGLAGVAGQPLLAYLVLWMGARLPLRLGVRDDLSYGLYICAFPVQQLLVIGGAAAALGVIGSFAAALAIALLLAWASWRLVERPALGLKSMPAPWRRPRRTG